MRVFNSVGFCRNAEAARRTGRQGEGVCWHYQDWSHPYAGRHPSYAW